MKRIVKIDKDGYIPLEAFRGMVDRRRVKSYSMEYTENWTDDGEFPALVIQFFDKDGKTLSVKGGEDEV